jgi:[CysO sulfur-carrier protein]-S-L-cysteine hydrolase
VTRAEIQGVLDLEGTLYDELVAHARSDFPFEVCGLLAGPDGQVAKAFRIPNAARSMTFYNMDPKPMLQAMREIDDREWDLLGIYHSHTHTEAYPSATDVELAVYPDVAYVIVSLQDDANPVIRAFDIDEEIITERTVRRDGEEVATGPR